MTSGVKWGSKAQLSHNVAHRCASIGRYGGDRPRGARECRKLASAMFERNGILATKYCWVLLKKKSCPASASKGQKCRGGEKIREEHLWRAWNRAHRQQRINLSVMFLSICLAPMPSKPKRRRRRRRMRPKRGVYIAHLRHLSPKMS